MIVEGGRCSVRQGRRQQQQQRGSPAGRRLSCPPMWSPLPGGSCPSQTAHSLRVEGQRELSTES